MVIFKNIKNLFTKSYNNIGLNTTTQGYPMINGQSFSNSDKRDFVNYWDESPTINTCINILTQNFCSIEFKGLPPAPNVYQTWDVLFKQYLYILKKEGLAYLVKIKLKKDSYAIIALPQNMVTLSNGVGIRPELQALPEIKYNININFNNIFRFSNILINESDIERVYDIAPETTTGLPRTRLDGIKEVVYGEVKLLKTYNNVLDNTFTVLAPAATQEGSIVDSERMAEAIAQFGGTSFDKQFFKIIKTPIALHTLTVDFKNFQKKDTEISFRSNIARAFLIDDILVGGSVGTYENTANASLNLFLQNLYPEAKKFCESINSLTGWGVDFVKQYTAEQVSSGSNANRFNNSFNNKLTNDDIQSEDNTVNGDAR